MTIQHKFVLFKCGEENCIARKELNGIVHICGEKSAASSRVFYKQPSMSGRGNLASVCIALRVAQRKLGLCLYSAASRSEETWPLFVTELRIAQRKLGLCL